MKKKLSVALALAAGLITGFMALIIIFQLMGFSWNDTPVLESCQGDYIKYNSYDPYCLRIIKQHQVLSSNYIILISRKADLEYGHVINYLDPLAASEEEIKKTRVIWSNEGIEMTFPMGHKLYIPKEKFTGGR